MDNEHFPVLAAHPADVSPGGCFNKSGHEFKVPESEIDEQIFAIGIELLNIFPAFRVKLSDCPPGKERMGAITGRKYEKRFPSKVHQYHQFEILDIIFWRDIQIPHVVLNQLC